MLLLAGSIKLVVEVALMVLLGRAALGALIGAQRLANPVYRGLDLAATPPLRLTRALLPARVGERGLVWATLGWLLLAWCLALAFKVRVCLEIGMAACRP
jgi:hypothetical protein